MDEHKILRVLDKVSFIYEKFGIDYKIMRKILGVKLTIDGRRVPSALSLNKEPKERKGLTNLLLAYGFAGIFIMFFVFINFPIFVKMSFILGVIIFMIMATMVSDFSTVLLDINDKNILLSKPIDLKTLNAAKLTHIFIYMATITLVISGPSLIAFLIKYGMIPFLIFFIELFFISGFVILFTSILYFIILLFFNGEKLKDIINYFQIILSILMLISYQLIGRIFELSNLKVVITPRWWHFLIPSTWFAAPFSIFMEHNTSYYYIALSLFGIAIPILALLAYIKFVIPFFEKNLQKLSDNSMKKSKRNIKIQRLNKLFSQLFCLNALEGSFFRFTKIMISNERKLKLKIYPTLAYAVVMPMIILFSFLSGTSSISMAISNIASSKYYFVIYLSMSMLIPLLSLISRSDNYNGAWIYRVLPIATPEPIFKGAFKSYLIKCIMPVNLAISLLFLGICGFRILPDIILILLNLILLCILIANRSEKLLPFSKDFAFIQDNNTGLVMVSLLVCAIIAGLHYVLTSYKYGVTLDSIITVIVIFVLWKNTYKISWKEALLD